MICVRVDRFEPGPYYFSLTGGYHDPTQLFIYPWTRKSLLGNYWPEMILRP